MADTPNQQAKAWGKLKVDNVKKAADISAVSKKNALLIKIIGELSAALAKDLYGSASDEKYIKIVNLIEKRLADVANASLEDVIAQFTSLKDELKEIDPANNVEISDKLLKSISSNALTLLDSLKKELFDFLDKQIVERLKKADQKEDDNSEIEEELAEEDTEDEEIEEENENALDKMQSIIDMINKLLPLITQTTLIAYEYFSKVDDMFSSLAGNMMKKKMTPEQLGNATLENLNKTSVKVNSLIPTKKELKLTKKDQLTLEDVHSKLFHLMASLTNPYLLIYNSLDYILDSIISCVKRNLLRAFALIIAPITVALFLLMKTIVAPLMKILLPLFDAVATAVCFVMESITRVINEICGPMIEFFVEVIGPPAAKLVKAIAIGIVRILNELDRCLTDQVIAVFVDFAKTTLGAIRDFLRGFGTNIEEIGRLSGQLFIMVVERFTAFFEGISSKAEDIGKEVARFALNVFESILNMLKGFGTYAKDIGIKIGEFVTEVLETVNLVLTGFASKAEEVGEKFGYCVIEIRKCCTGVVKLLTALAYRFDTLLKRVVEFLEGLGLSAKKIGEKFGEYSAISLEIRNIMLQEMAKKATFVGKYLASKLLKDLHDVNNLIVHLRVACGDTDATEDLSADQKIIGEIRDKLKGFAEKIDDMMPSWYEREYGNRAGWIARYCMKIADNLWDIYAYLTETHWHPVGANEKAISINNISDILKDIDFVALDKAFDRAFNTKSVRDDAEKAQKRATISINESHAGIESLNDKILKLKGDFHARQQELESDAQLFKLENSEKMTTFNELCKTIIDKTKLLISINACLIHTMPEKTSAIVNIAKRADFAPIVMTDVDQSPNYAYRES